MKNLKKTPLPSLPPRAPGQLAYYPGLGTDFGRQRKELCKILAGSPLWDDWTSLFFQTPSGNFRSFPLHQGMESQLLFLDQWLFYRLCADAKTGRPNLNKHRSWVLHRILRQLSEREKERTEGRETKKRAYALPGDVDALVADLWLFETHIKKPDPGLGAYPTLDDLANVVAIFRPAPLAPQKTPSEAGRRDVPRPRR